MKKCIRIILIIGSIIFGFYLIQPQAKIFYENPSLNSCATGLNTEVEFNVLKGYTDNQELKDSWFLAAYNDFVSGELENGEMYLEGTIVGDSGSKKLKTTFYVENYDLLKYQAAIENDVFFEFVMEDYSPRITISNEVDLNKIIGYSSHNFRLVSDFTVYFDREDAVDVEMDTFYIKEMGFNSIFSMVYSYNQPYQGQDVHFITESKAPITIEEIINSLEVTDATEGDVSRIEIADSTYNLDNNNHIEPGNYEFTIIARDSSGNTTLQPCEINVVDVTPPTITGRNISMSYVVKSPEENLLGYFTATDDSGIANIRIIRNDYDKNYNIPGEYVVEAEATDNYGNSATATMIVTVVDDKAPIITLDRNATITTLDNYELDDFKRFVKITDYCDGDIEEYTITDLNDYLNNKNKIGKYEFLVEASDKAGNSISSKLVVNVIDRDFPEIQASAYTIIVSEGSEITKEQIIELLSKVGQVDSSDDVVLSSNYFEEENPMGSYDLNVRVSDELSYDNEIQVVKKGETGFSYEIPKPIKKNNNSICFIIGGILFVGVLFSGGLGIVIWRKRH